MTKQQQMELLLEQIRDLHRQENELKARRGKLQATYDKLWEETKIARLQADIKRSEKEE